MRKRLHSLYAIGLGLLALVCIVGCSKKRPIKALSEEHISEANQWFSSIAVDGDQISPSRISCFFTSYYADPCEIDMVEFLRYCPVGVMLTDADSEEFLAWMEAAQWPGHEGNFQKPSEFYVLVRRLANADVSAILMQYAGISTADLKNYGSAVYLDKYDAFYNYTSDFAPGRFECTGGETDGRIVRFWSETTPEGVREVLTMELVGDQYLIRAFQQEKIP